MHRVLTAISVLTVVLSTAGARTAAGPYPDEVWVLGAGEQVFAIRTATLDVAATIDISEPTGSVEPGCLAFSTATGAPLVAFVGQGSKIKLFDVRTRNPLLPHRDLGVLTGVPGLTIRACASASARSFDSPLGPVVRNHLFFAADDPTGGVVYAVVDQAALIANTPGALVTSGTLHPDATARDVRVLGSPAGTAFQRSRFLLGRSGATGPELLVVPLSLDSASGSGATIGDAETFSTVGPLPERLRLGTPCVREFPVLAIWDTGTVHNLDTGDQCTFGGNLVAASTPGAGPNSFSLLVSRLPNEILSINPNNCVADTITVGQTPVDIAPVGLFDWKGAFVANRDSDNVTFIAESGSTTDVPLDPGSEPIALEVLRSPKCTIRELMLDIRDVEGDGARNDVHLEWTRVGCSSTQEYFIWCMCLDDPLDCDCACDCETAPNDPSCSCPLNDDNQGTPQFLMNYPPPGIEFTKNPWKMLDNTFAPDYDDLNAAENGDNVDYQVTATDDPPALPP